MHTCLKFRKGTNWTMSRRTGSPLGDLRIPSSPSSICMSLKSAFPTPTMMTDMGRWEAWTMASRVSAMSVMTPSVRISRMKYCWSQKSGGRWERKMQYTISQVSISRWSPCRTTTTAGTIEVFVYFFNFLLRKFQSKTKIAWAPLWGHYLASTIINIWSTLLYLLAFPADFVLFFESYSVYHSISICNMHKDENFTNKTISYV